MTNRWTRKWNANCGGIARGFELGLLWERANLRHLVTSRSIESLKTSVHASTLAVTAVPVPPPTLRLGWSL